jgi:hypothetical protein
MHILFKLSETHYVGGEPWDQIDSRQHFVFPSFTPDQYGASPFNVHHITIAKEDGAMHFVVDLRECTSFINHVVHSARVEDPLRVVATLPVPMLNEQPSLIEVNRWSLWRGHQFCDGGTGE